MTKEWRAQIRISWPADYWPSSTEKVEVAQRLDSTQCRPDYTSMELGKPTVSAFIVITAPSRHEASRSAEQIVAEYYAALPEGTVTMEIIDVTPENREKR